MARRFELSRPLQRMYESIALRYFNAAGSDNVSDPGERGA